MRNPDQSKLMELIRDYATLSWQEGIFVGWNNSAEFLVDQSGQLYVNGKDEEARLTRQLGYDVKRDSRARSELEKPKRDKRKKEIYDEILKILSEFPDSEAKNPDALDPDKLIEEIRNRRKRG